MAIIKLKEIVESKRGEIDNPAFFSKEKKAGYFPLYSAGTNLKGWYSKFNRKKNIIVVSSSGANAGSISIPNQNFFASDCFTIKTISNSVLQEYLNYWFLKHQTDIFALQRGSAQPHVYFKDIAELEFKIISMKSQKSIIDIIEKFGLENFKKYSKIIRIDSELNCKKDIGSIIDIIEPINILNEKILRLKIKIISLLKNIYSLNSLDEIELNDLITSWKNDKFSNEAKYFATNAVGEFAIDFNKIINIEDKIPSRANLKPFKNSFILSKLFGENKIFYFFEQPSEIFSTGFLNFATQNIDHLSSFFVSKEFQKQKKNLSTGTTMIGLTLENFKKIKIKKPQSSNNFLTFAIYNLAKMHVKVNKVMSKLVELLIK